MSAEQGRVAPAMNDAVANEPWDVIDAAGNPTGRVTLRGAPEFAAGEYHVVVGTIVIDGSGQLLVTRRSPEKTHPGRWEFPAGSALSGEESLTTAQRELLEETGVDAPIGDFVKLGTLLQKAQWFDVYAVRVPGRPEVTPQPGEVDDFAWVSPEAVLDTPRGVDFAPPWHERIGVVEGALRELLGA